MLRRLKPVSYTHLDVYKRQVKGLTAGQQLEKDILADVLSIVG